MNTIRIYCDQQLQVGNHVALSRAATHHVCTVLRLTPGAKLIVFNGDGYDYHATLQSTGKQAHVDIEQAARNNNESPLHIHLLQGLSRTERMDATIQKAVELGVSEITPLYTEKTHVKFSSNRLLKKQQHWQSIIIAACEQCGRSVVPKLHAPVKLTGLLSSLDLSTEDTALLFDPRATTLLGDIASARTNYSILIGPESGFSSDEQQKCIASGFKAVSLGPRIMRTETAGSAVLAVLQARHGDLCSVHGDQSS